MRHVEPWTFLEIEEYEYRALLEVREGLASGFYTHNPGCGSRKARFFNMGADYHYSACRTTACIGGWMAMGMGMARHRDVERYVWRVRSPALDPLFFPDDLPDDLINDSASWGTITPAQAVRAIDSFLTTGKPNWRAAIA